MHNGAVVQGLSEAPFMWDMERWGVMTIGTGLGNTRFTNLTSRQQLGWGCPCPSEPGAGWRLRTCGAGWVRDRLVRQVEACGQRLEGAVAPDGLGCRTLRRGDGVLRLQPSGQCRCQHAAERVTGASAVHRL